MDTCDIYGRQSALLTSVLLCPFLASLIHTTSLVSYRCFLTSDPHLLRRLAVSSRYARRSHTVPCHDGRTHASSCLITYPVYLPLPACTRLLDILLGRSRSVLCRPHTFCYHHARSSRLSRSLGIPLPYVLKCEALTAKHRVQCKRYFPSNAAKKIRRRMGL